MMKYLPIVGESYKDFAPGFSSQECINFWPILNESQDRVDQIQGYLAQTPGTLQVSTTGATLPHRIGGGIEFGGNIYCVSGNGVYIYNPYTMAMTSLGTITSSEGAVYMEKNSYQIIILDTPGNTGWVIDTRTNSLTQITSPNFICGTAIAVLDDYAYMVVPNNTTYQLQQSNFNDFTTWGNLAFNSLTTQGDQAVGIVEESGSLWIAGSYGIEKHIDAPDSTNPEGVVFQRDSGVYLNDGIPGPRAYCAVDNMLYYVSRSQSTGSRIKSSTGWNPTVVSTPAVNQWLSNLPTLSDLILMPHSVMGHTIIQVTSPSGNSTMCLDVSTKAWHKRSSYGTGANGRHLANWILNCRDKIYIGSCLDGSIHEMSMNFPNENGNILLRNRTCQYLSSNGNLTDISELEVFAETGTGISTGTDYETNPKINLEVSYDKGRTWLDLGYREIGAIGEYDKRLVWRKLGYSDRWLFRFTTSTNRKVNVLAVSINTSERYS